MNEFKRYHPIVNFIYFVLVIGFSCFFMNPICLGISLAGGLSYAFMLKGIREIVKNLKFILPVALFMAIINPLFNHEGATILAYFPNSNPLTLESIVYGICAAGMIVSVIMQFTCYNEVMTSDKFIYLFGRIIPAMSLIISMTLRFVPRFIHQLKIVTNAQRCIGRDVSSGKIVNRGKNALNIMSIMTTWALENAVDTADSMKARGYGLFKRTSFSIYTFDKKDKKALIGILVFGAYTLAGGIMEKLNFSFFPYIKMAESSAYGISVFGAYFLLCMTPVIIELWEVRKWKAYVSKI